MGKRYAFWREPAGRPYRGNDDSYAPSKLLAEIGTSASVKKQGAVSWRGSDIMHLKLALQAFVVIQDPEGDELNPDDAWSITNSALLSIITRHGGGTPVKPPELIEAANREAAEHFRKSPVDYVLVSSLSVESFPASRIKIGDCEISPLKSRGWRYPCPDIMKTRSRRTGVDRHLESTKYQGVRVSTHGRSAPEATHRALVALDLLRGLWTLFGTYGSWSMSFVSIQMHKPLGPIHLGPIHTLHSQDGKLIGKNCWYDPAFVEDQDLFKPEHGWGDIEKRRRWALNRIRRPPYGREVINLIGRYAAALDYRDPHLTFLHMWNILEKITNTVGGKYDDTIQRVIWPFADPLLEKDILESVRLRRNRYVHASAPIRDPRQFNYIVKFFVEPHLLNLIRNDFNVASLEEYAQFLALSRSLDQLVKRRSVFARAIQIVKEWKNHDGRAD